MNYFVSELQSMLSSLWCAVSVIFSMGLFHYYVVFFGGKDDVNKDSIRNEISKCFIIQTVCFIQNPFSLKKSAIERPSKEDPMLACSDDFFSAKIYHT